ncbi:trans-sialidase, putative, partial [Trypanosoma cruzi marinkellei]
AGVFREKVNESWKGKLHLWLTDNTHIADIGPVSGEGDDVAASSLLYKSEGGTNELIALYEKKGSGEASVGMVPVRLTEQLERVKEVVKTWKEVDERVSQLCTTLLAQKFTSTGAACSADKITDGLVGFLSGNYSDDTWIDEYLGVNATVKVKEEAVKATETFDGVTFKGAWAEWRVCKQGQNQPYHFANYNFTLVATVSIDGEPTQEGPIPLMGVRQNDEKKKTNLWSCHTGKEGNGRYCAVGSRRRSTSAIGGQVQHTKWPLCYRTAPMAQFTLTVSVWIRHVNWKMRI